MEVIVCNVLDIFSDQLLRPHSAKRHPWIGVIDFNHSSYFPRDRRIPAQHRRLQRNDQIHVFKQWPCFCFFLNHRIVQRSYAGRRDVGVLRDRQRDDRADAHQHDDDRDHPGEDRAIDEDPRHALSQPRAEPRAPFIAPGGGALTFCGALAGTGLIGAPSLRLAVPCVMTFSPGARPWVTTQYCPWARSATIGALDGAVAGPTTHRVALPWDGG